MKKLKTISLMLSVVMMVTCAQAQEKKSRYKSLSERNIATDQSAPALLDQAHALMVSDPSLALDKVEQALAISITQKSIFNEASCYYSLGQINESLGELELARQNYAEAYERWSMAYQTTTVYQDALESLGRVNFLLEEYQRSKLYYQTLSKTDLNESKRLDVELRLAEIEVALGEAPAALDRVEQLKPNSTYNASQKLKSKGRAIQARAYAQQEDYAAAEQSLLPSIQTAGDEGTTDVAQSEVVAGAPLEDDEAEELLNVYQKQDRKEEEIALRENIADRKIQSNQPLQANRQKLAIGKVMMSQGRTLDAVSQLEQAASLAAGTENFEEQTNTYLALAKAYQKSGTLDKALEAFESYSVASQAWSRQQQNERTTRLQWLKKQQDIDQLTADLALDESSYLLEETTLALQAQQLRSQRLIIYGLLLVLVLVLLGAYLILKHAQKTKRVGQLLALKSLRSQMNPHFIFNALNAVNQFVALNDERAANKFLADFSKLMRMVLDNSEKEFITLREEKVMLELYLKLEHYRFRDQFDYEFSVDTDLDLDEIDLPPMLIQPYIENAIWHGLRYKKEKGHLLVRAQKNGASVKIVVEDNGIGREESGRLKTTHQKLKSAVGLKNTRERIAIINQVYRTQFQINITDLNAGHTGTRVEILTPIHHA